MPPTNGGRRTIVEQKQKEADDDIADCLAGQTPFETGLAFGSGNGRVHDAVF